MAEVRRIKDKHGLVPAEYLIPDSRTYMPIKRALAIATAEISIGIDSADIAKEDDEEEGDEGSGSDED